MSEISDLAERFKQKSTKTAQTIEQALQTDLDTLHTSFMKSLGESETIIKEGTESLNDKKTKLEESLTLHHDAINTMFSQHIDDLQTLTMQKLADQDIEITTMMGEYSIALKKEMAAHHTNVLDFIERRAWIVVIVCAIVVLLLFALGVFLGTQIR